MALKTILFAAAFGICVILALWQPVFGILGYVAHYSIGPERQWWHAPLSGLGIRYSMFLAALTAFGIVIRFRKLGIRRPYFLGQERLILLFLGIVWLTVALSETTISNPSDAASVHMRVVDHPATKLAKVVFFAMMLTHVITNLRDYNRLVWVLIAGSLVLGLQAYSAGRAAFNMGRLESVGGADFMESNMLAAYLAAMLPIIGIQFMRTSWFGRALCLASGIFATNAIVLTRSRGSLIGLGVGAVTTVLLAPSKYRGKLIVGLLVVAAGAYYLMDPQFLRRASTINNENRDASVSGRIETWQASLAMLKDHPLGVGAGNFSQFIGRYDPRFAFRDAHSTYVRCIGELGLEGALLMLLLILHAFRVLFGLMRRAKELPQPMRDSVTYASLALTVSLATLLACGLTITLLYVEILWWLLAMPVCLTRVVDNFKIGAATEPKPSSPDDAVKPLPPRRSSRKKSRQRSASLG